MKVKQNVTVYQCEHCKRNMFKKGAMEQHEKWCPKNPENIKACQFCSYLKEVQVTCFGEHHYDGSEYIFERKGFKCEKLDKLLYPLKAERRDLPSRFPEHFFNQMPMPKECEHFDDGHFNF